MLRQFTTSELTEFSYFALAIRRVSAQQLHCAIAYKSESDDICLLHLAFNKRFGKEPYTDGDRWVRPDIPESTSKLLAVLAHKIKLASPLVPSGLDYAQLTFDLETG